MSSRLRYPDIALCIALCIVTSPGFAQCQAGIPSEGNPQCIPPEVYGGQRSAEPQAPSAAKRRWAALAIGQSAAGSVIGEAFGAGSERQARRIASADCKRRGGQACASVAFSQTCAALAWATDRYAIESAADREQAAASAMAACERIGGEDCQLFRTVCTDVPGAGLEE
jgi:hypothetical protein